MEGEFDVGAFLRQLKHECHALDAALSSEPVDDTKFNAHVATIQELKTQWDAAVINTEEGSNFSAALNAFFALLQPDFVAMDKAWVSQLSKSRSEAHHVYRSVPSLSPPLSIRATLSADRKKQKRSRSLSTSSSRRERTAKTERTSTVTLETKPAKPGGAAKPDLKVKLPEFFRGRQLSSELQPQISQDRRSLSPLPSHHPRSSSPRRDSTEISRLEDVVKGPFLVEGCTKIYKMPTMLDIRDAYRDIFFPAIHYNYICERDGQAVAIFSVLATPVETHATVQSFADVSMFFNGLVTTNSGHYDFLVASGLLKHKTGTSVADSIEVYLNAQAAPGHSFYQVHDPKFPVELGKIEKQVPLKKTEVKYGVLYCRKSSDIEELEQVHEPDENSRFWTFMEALGHRINTKGWTGYLGDFKTSGVDTQKDTFYSDWNKLEIMYHVAPLLNEEQHRRLIGNDIILIIYYDNATEPFDELVCEALGKMPQMYALVTPRTSDSYGLRFFKRTTLPAFEPRSPLQDLTLPVLKEVLLTKCFNAYQLAFQVPPLNRLVQIPRENLIHELAQHFPRAGKNKNSPLFTHSSKIGTPGPDEQEAVAQRKADLELEDFLDDPEGIEEPTGLLLKHKQAL